MQTAAYKRGDLSSGNRNWPLFLQSCYLLAGQSHPELGEAAKYEQCLYGSLGGNLNAMGATVRNDVYDYLWACGRTWLVQILKSEYGVQVKERITDFANV